MYPSIALFYPNLAQAVLKYRVQTVGGARINAQQQGYKVWDILSPTAGNLKLVI